MKIEDELRKTQSEPRELESEVARRNAERRLFGTSGTGANQTDRIRQEMQRYASMRDPVMRYSLKKIRNPDLTCNI
jgi:hypothetical protein